MPYRIDSIWNNAWIDPDGQSVGDGPIYVYCDVAKLPNILYNRNGVVLQTSAFYYLGSTSELHDSESPRDVGHCVNPGSYL